MGACNFTTYEFGKDSKDAFKTAREEALYMHGHGGYTGTLAEKDYHAMSNKPKTIHPYKWENWVCG